MSLQETSFDYDHIVWNCSLLPYRIIVCVDCIQYIVQLREQSSYRNLSFFTEWEPIGRRYPQLVTSGLPEQSPNMLSHELRRLLLKLNERSADREVETVQMVWPGKVYQCPPQQCWESVSLTALHKSNGSEASLFDKRLSTYSSWSRMCHLAYFYRGQSQTETSCYIQTHNGRTCHCHPWCLRLVGSAQLSLR